MVSRMKTLVQGIQLVITRIKAGRQLLGISATNIEEIEASYDALLTSAGTYVNLSRGQNVFQAMPDYLGA